MFLNLIGRRGACFFQNRRESGAGFYIERGAAAASRRCEFVRCAAAEVLASAVAGGGRCVLSTETTTAARLGKLVCYFTGTWPCAYIVYKREHATRHERQKGMSNIMDGEW